MNSSNLRGKKLPKTSDLQAVYQQAKYKKTFWETIRSTVFMLVVVAAFAVLIAVLFLPILRIYGNSMKGTLNSGDIVVSVKSNDFESSDVVAFYYNNNILVKHVIAEAGDWVDMDKQGNVYVNNQRLDEPYLANRDYSHTDIEFPYQVPENRIFVMGDNRKESIDSRNNAIGTVSNEQIVGKLVFKIWPLPELGWIE
ncbi:TPA: signal peptidase I [Streptococcus suis]|uniref:Signal peptidase I n=1 Tax=Streptococcus suis TaxID=1307 RepID=A0A7Y6VF22_STRSU|nr:signal peptidase I [Streptococcus suis]AHF58924.1 Signal peptidase I [Streptococcus suis 05HAS68]ALA28318.1 signal peptidase [Streptococcus suis]AMU78978.1 signal peptidase I [Streptococcus suis]AUW25599.1 signal peptidase I [Streptococcus suis]KPA56409.1 signal peptidase [Streptococcus suis]